MRLLIMDIYYKIKLKNLKEKILTNYIKKNYNIESLENEIKEYNFLITYINSKVNNLELMKINIDSLKTQKTIVLTSMKIPLKKYKKIEIHQNLKKRKKYKYYDGLDCFFFFKKLKTINKCQLIIYKDTFLKSKIKDGIDIWESMYIYDFELFYELFDFYKKNEDNLDGIRCILSFEGDSNYKKEYLWNKITNFKFINKNLNIYIIQTYSGDIFKEADIKINKAYRKIKLLKVTSNEDKFLTFEKDTVILNINNGENCVVDNVSYDENSKFSDITVKLSNSKILKFKDSIPLRYNGIGKKSNVILFEDVLINKDLSNNFDIKLPIKCNIIINGTTDYIEFFLNQNYNFDDTELVNYVKKIFSEKRYKTFEKNIELFFKKLEDINILDYFSNTSIENIIRQSNIINQKDFDAMLNGNLNLFYDLSSRKRKIKYEGNLPKEIIRIINIYNIILAYVV